MVTEIAHIELGEQPVEEVETSFKLAPQKKETIEEFVTLEQPSETTEVEEIQTSFKLAAQKKETIEEFVTLEQPAEATVTLKKEDRPKVEEEVVEQQV